MHRSRVRQSLRVLLVVTLVLVAIASGAANAVVAIADTTQTSNGAALPAADPVNNTTVQHENPETVSGQGNVSDVRAWLGLRLASRLERSTIRITQGQYQRARNLLGDQYNSYLDKYVDVAGPTAGDDARVGEELNRTRAIQREYVSTLQEYWKTYEAYRKAKQAGNEQRARELARRLNNLSAQLRRMGGNLTRQYNNVSNLTGVGLKNATQRIQRTTANVTNQTQAVVRAEFARTNVTVTAQSNRTSFTNPLSLTGRITTENGTVPSGHVTVRVGGIPHRVDLGPNGEFTLSWRPRTVRTGAQSVHVRYIPDETSVYLGSNATTTVTVTQVTPTVTVRADESARFGRPVTVDGRVVANDTGIGGIPLRVRVGGVTVTTVRTGPNGTYSTSFALPAEVPAGQRTVRVLIPLTDRAIAGAAANSTLQVRETATNMVVDATWRAGTGTLVVRGRLLTADGRPVPNQTVRLQTETKTLTTAVTNASGYYHVTVSSGIATAPDVIHAHYDGAGTNLGSSNASATVEAIGGRADGATFLSVVDRSVLGVALMVVGSVFLVVAGAVYWRRRDSSAATTAPTSSTGSATGNPDGEPNVSPSQMALTAARDALDANDTARAVSFAYAAVRQTLDDGAEESALTHWEFLRAHADGTDDARADALRVLTESYETVTFAPVDVGTDRAKAAVDAAHTLLTTESA